MITSKEVPQETLVGFSWMKNITINGKKWPIMNKNGEKYGNLSLCLLLFLKKDESHDREYQRKRVLLSWS